MTNNVDFYQYSSICLLYSDWCYHPVDTLVTHSLNSWVHSCWDQVLTSHLDFNPAHCSQLLWGCNCCLYQNLSDDYEMHDMMALFAVIQGGLACFKYFVIFLVHIRYFLKGRKMMVFSIPLLLFNSPLNMLIYERAFIN